MKILLTGATGFVGRHVLTTLLEAGHAVRAVTRGEALDHAGNVQWWRIGDIGPDTDWEQALGGIDTVLHLAGHAHDSDPDAHHRVNCLGTRRLAEAAAGQVRRLVFVSSLSVHGLAASETPVTDATPLRPTSAYGTAKARAEEALDEIGAREGLETFSLRPAVVYGPHAPGNVGRLMRAVARGIPLPLAGIDNCRSLLGRDNLARALLACAEAPSLTAGAAPVADSTPLSTPAMIRALAVGAGRPARLWPCPVTGLRLAGAVTGRRRMIEQLTRSLVVDSAGLVERIGEFRRGETEAGLAEAMRTTMETEKGTQ